MFAATQHPLGELIVSVALLVLSALSPNEMLASYWRNLALMLYKCFALVTKISVP